MIILIDMDEVLSDFEGRLSEIWEEKYPHTLLFPGGVRDSFRIGSGDQHGRADLIQKIIYKEGFFESLKPVKGAKEAVAEMRRLGHSVFILTSPGISYPHAAIEKFKWVEKHFGKDMLERLIVTPAKPIIRGDILIDDRPEIPYAEHAQWEHVLYEKSYNKGVEDRRRLTWDNWQDILSELFAPGAPTET